MSEDSGLFCRSLQLKAFWVRGLWWKVSWFALGGQDRPIASAKLASSLG